MIVCFLDCFSLFERQNFFSACGLVMALEVLHLEMLFGSGYVLAC
jgi:hypothetical protein